MSCHACRDPDIGPPLREEWGCDAPRREPVIVISCAVCGGKDARCEICRGTNEVGVHECPRKLVRRVHFDICRAAILVEHGHLPAPGGWMDQAYTFLAALDVVQAELEHYRERARKEASRK